MSKPCFQVLIQSSKTVSFPSLASHTSMYIGEKEKRCLWPPSVTQEIYAQSRTFWWTLTFLPGALLNLSLFLPATTRSRRFLHVSNFCSLSSLSLYNVHIIFFLCHLRLPVRTDFFFERKYFSCYLPYVPVSLFLAVYTACVFIDYFACWVCLQVQRYFWEMFDFFMTCL